MAFPPRPRSSRAEPSLAPAAPSRDAVPLRPPAPRPLVRPAVADAATEREPVRLAAEPRRAGDMPELSLTAADRIVVSSAITGGGKRERSGLRVFGFALLLALAAIGAYSLYHEASAFLP
jgi:hypothetical protein